MKIRGKRFLAACAGLALLVSTPSIASADSTESIEEKEVQIVQLGPSHVGSGEEPIYGGVPEDLKDDVASTLPKTVTVDAETGDVTDVVFDEEQVAPMATPNINYCPASLPCWYGAFSPDAYIGFSGTGSAYGPWSGRGDFQTRARPVQLCWLRPTAPGIPSTEICGARQGVHTRVIFTDRVTGTRVSIF